MGARNIYKQFNRLFTKGFIDVANSILSIGQFRPAQDTEVTTV